jgi:UDP-N-acetylmuramate dehydrogenase
MTASRSSSPTQQLLHDRFGDLLKQHVPMAKYTSTRVGGRADYLLTAENATQLEEFVKTIWKLDLALLVIGFGSNILVSDKGIREIVIVNHADRMEVHADSKPPSIVAESGASLAALSHLAGENSLSGLEWSSPIPGSVGGALYGNAGAHGGEICKNLLLAEILHRSQGKISLDCEHLRFGYRTSLLKMQPKEMVILNATFRLEKGNKEQILEKMKGFNEKRHCSQPTGPSFGSTFRNPSGQRAGKLIEDCGLKGTQVGDAVISPMHANFIINRGKATAIDFMELMLLMQNKVQQKFGVRLQPEIELVGEWDNHARRLFSEERNG